MPLSCQSFWYANDSWPQMLAVYLSKKPTWSLAVAHLIPRVFVTVCLPFPERLTSQTIKSLNRLSQYLGAAIACSSNTVYKHVYTGTLREVAYSYIWEISHIPVLENIQLGQGPPWLWSCPLKNETTAGIGPFRVEIDNFISPANPTRKSNSSPICWVEI